MASGTNKNTLVQWKTFNKFCDKLNIHEWPTSTETLCLFAQHLASRMRSVKTIESYLYGVVNLHLYAGVKPPDIKTFKVKLTLKGIKRKLKHRVRQAKPITPPLLIRIHDLLDFKEIDDVVFWAILLTSFYLLLRKSNLVPDSQETFDKNKQLTRRQVKVTKNSVAVAVTWSKTIQFHQRKLKLKMYSLPNNVLCPVKAFTRLLSMTDPKPEESCFLTKQGLPFSYNMLNYRIKKFLKLTGVKQYSKFSPHSLRRGGLLAGFKAGLPKKLLKVLGDWRSECFEVYLSFPKQIRDKAAKTIRNTLKKFSK